MTDAPAGKPKGKAAGTNEDATSAAPSVGRRRPVALLLQAGAIAAAIGSISGIVLGVVHAVDSGHSDARTTAISDGRTTASRPARVRLTVPRPSVHPKTFAESLKARGINPKYAQPDQANDLGVMVAYHLDAPGYPRDASFTMKFLVFRVRPGGDESFVNEFSDQAQLEVDSDLCTCPSPFIPIPRVKGMYRIEVQVFRPKTHSPTETASTELFRGFG